MKRVPLADYSHRIKLNSRSNNQLGGESALGKLVEGSPKIKCSARECTEVMKALAEKHKTDSVKEILDKEGSKKEDHTVVNH